MALELMEAAPTETGNEIDVSKWENDQLIRRIAMIDEEARDIKDARGFFAGELLRRMQDKKQRDLPHPDFEVNRETAYEWAMTEDDARLFVKRARRLGYTEAEIEKAVKIEVVTVYSTSRSSIVALAKRAGSDLQDLADNMTSDVKSDRVVVKPKGKPKR